MDEHVVAMAAMAAMGCMDGCVVHLVGYMMVVWRSCRQPWAAWVVVWCMKWVVWWWCGGHGWM